MTLCRSATLLIHHSVKRPEKLLIKENVKTGKTFNSLLVQSVLFFLFFVFTPFVFSFYLSVTSPFISAPSHWHSNGNLITPQLFSYLSCEGFKLWDFAFLNKHNQIFFLPQKTWAGGLSAVLSSHSPQPLRHTCSSQHSPESRPRVTAACEHECGSVFWKVNIAVATRKRL